jgi:NAD(P)-dependent dehydrogenase (short-subunit alcohol dehydrogenase family)
VLSYQAEGADFVATGSAGALAEEIRGRGGRCQALAADRTRTQDRARVREILARPDVAMLVNHAGASAQGEVLRVPGWQASAMVALNVSSTAAFKPMAGLVVHGATKAFVKEASRGVDVCVVFPGPLRTPLLEAALGRPPAPAGRVGRWLERGSFMDTAVCVRRPRPGSPRAGGGGGRPGRPHRGRPPRRVIRRLDTWAPRHLTGS